MPKNEAVRVAINGCGVIGNRVVDAVALQDDMVVAGVCDVATDWRSRVITQRGFQLHGAAPENVTAMKDAGLEVHGTLSDLLARRSASPRKISTPTVGAT